MKIKDIKDYDPSVADTQSMMGSANAMESVNMSQSTMDQSMFSERLRMHQNTIQSRSTLNNSTIYVSRKTLKSQSTKKSIQKPRQTVDSGADAHPLHSMAENMFKDEDLLKSEGAESQEDEVQEVVEVEELPLKEYEIKYQTLETGSKASEMKVLDFPEETEIVFSEENIATI